MKKNCFKNAEKKYSKNKSILIPKNIRMGTLEIQKTLPLMKTSKIPMFLFGASLKINREYHSDFFQSTRIEQNSSQKVLQTPKVLKCPIW